MDYPEKHISALRGAALLRASNDLRDRRGSRSRPWRSWIARLALLVMFFPTPGVSVLADDGVVAGGAKAVPESAVQLAHLDRSRPRPEETVPEVQRLPNPLRLLAPSPASAAPTRRHGRSSVARNSTIHLVSLPLPEQFGGDETDTRRSNETAALRSLRREFDRDRASVYAELVGGRPAASRLPVDCDDCLKVRYPAADDPRRRAFRRLSTKIAFRHIRRFFRDLIESEFKEDPTFSHDEYIARREEMRGLGRGNDDDLFLELVEDVRNDVLQRDPDEIEPGVTLIDWGPFKLDDSGSLGIDVNRIGNERFEDLDQIELAPEEKIVRKPLFHGRRYKVNTDLKFRPRFDALIDGGDYREVIGKIAASVSIDFRSQVRERKYFSAELETTVRPNGDAAVFVNFVIYGN